MTAETFDDEGLRVERVDEHIVIRATYDAGWGPTVTVRDETFLDAIEKRAGKDDARVHHDSEFDRRFTLSGFSNTLCRAVACTAFNEHMKQLPRGLELRCTSDMAELRLPADAGEHVPGAIAALRALCSVSLRWLAPFREIPDAVFVPASGPWGAREDAHVKVQRRGVTTKATIAYYLEVHAPLRRDGPRFHTTWKAGAFHPELPAEWVDAELLEAAKRMTGSTTIGCNGSAWATLHGDVDVERASATCDVVVLLARSDTRGAYR